MSYLPSIYIIGAQCTGKTTLIHGLIEFFSERYDSLPFHVVTEVARKVLHQHDFSREDISSNPERALQLQKLILTAQYEEEVSRPGTALLSDRSGVDPIVYGLQYGPSDAQKTLLDSPQLRYLRERMNQSLVILCPPHLEWLIDDGTRLMSKDPQEWHNTHRAFIDVLEATNINYHVIPGNLVKLEDRVNFVVRHWEIPQALDVLGGIIRRVENAVHDEANVVMPPSSAQLSLC
ncbi:hypothetical protein MW887_005754 [Aspergillus wentii]|nr:hypothetical protein MW887_005754 [Aspergillus wentii]